MSRPKIDREHERLRERVQRCERGLLAGYELIAEAQRITDRAREALRVYEESR